MDHTSNRGLPPSNQAFPCMSRGGEKASETVRRYHLEVAEETKHDFLTILNVDTSCRDFVALHCAQEASREENSISVNLDNPIATRRQIIVADVLPSLVEHHGVNPCFCFFPLEQMEVAVHIIDFNRCDPRRRARDQLYFHIAENSPLGATEKADAQFELSFE